jgi:hypothetical protein
LALLALALLAIALLLVARRRRSAVISLGIFFVAFLGRDDATARVRCLLADARMTACTRRSPPISPPSRAAARRTPNDCKSCSVDDYCIAPGHDGDYFCCANTLCPQGYLCDGFECRSPFPF